MLKIIDSEVSLNSGPRVKRENTIREAKVNIILDAAQRIFAQKGFHAARLEDIAAEAGFSKASLYNYYEDKESIFLSLAIRDYTKYVLSLNEIISIDAPLSKKLENILESVFRMFGEHFAIILEISNYLSTKEQKVEKLCVQHEILAKNFRQLHHEISLLIITLLRTSRQKGEIRSALSDKVLAKYFGSLIRGVIFEWKMRGKIGDWQLEAMQLVAFFLHGVA
jgi:AcrR family transcriptional regulator